MKTGLIISFFLLSSTLCCFAQHSEDSLWLTGTVFVKGVMLPSIYRNPNCADPSTFVNIYSVKDKVYSISASKVIAVFALGDEWTILTRAGGDTFFVYTGLRNVLIKEKDNLRVGDWLGLAQKDDDRGLFMTGFGIYKAHKSCSRDEVVRFLKRPEKSNP